MARTMLIVSGNLKTFWTKVVNTACYIIDRCMIRTIIDKNRYELLKGKKPNITHLRTFDSKCFVHNNKVLSGTLMLKLMRVCFWVTSHIVKLIIYIIKELCALKKVYM